MAHVADVARSADFYAKLGFAEQGSFTPSGESAPVWVSLVSGNAQLMLSRASAPVLPDEQAVLFYVYCADVAAMHAQLAADGVEPGPITKPFFNPEGEFRLVDPDGYVVIVAHL
jgi:catechol 2,3-dioxygenase-like lactoylglutathione lyase family enzyme